MLEYLRKRIASFGWAFKGLGDLFQNHPNAQIHLLATIVVVPLCFYLQLSAVEWAVIVICIAMVIAMEAVNTAIEYLADKISPEKDPLIGKAKDVAAGAVLVCAIGAVVVAGIILLPKLVAIF